MAQKLQHQLKEVGSKLENLPTSKDALIKLLKQAAQCLAELEQSPSPSLVESMQPCLNAIAKPELLKHQDRDVKVLVASCICEITRITAPEAPYSDDVLRDIFHLIVSTFSGLGDINSPSFGRRVIMLETLARYRSCVVMLDLECDELVNQMFQTFLAVVSDEHQESVLMSMQTIMVLLLEESEDIQENLLLILLSVLGREKSDVSLAARRLGMNVIQQCAGKLEPYIKQFLMSSMSGDSNSLNSQLDYHEVIYDIYQCAPQILGGIIPYITGELLTDQLDIRLKAVKLLGDLFALPNLKISETFRPLFSEFLKRLSDRVAEVRISVIEDVKKCLLSNPSRSEASEILNALSDRLLDYDENVRKQVVAAVFDMACNALNSVSTEIVRSAADRLRDKSLIVKRYTMERLAELYKLYCSKYSDGSIGTAELTWIPGRILRCLYDKDFRSETIEAVLCGSLSPTEFTIKEKVKLWVAVFSDFEKVDIKALEKLLLQKQRLQQEMLKYLSLRQAYQDGEAPELLKRILICFRTMSRLFTDPAKAEESFRVLNQLKDGNIWKILTSLLDPNTSFQQAYAFRDDLLKILGEKHPLYEFLDTLSMKCSYLLFNKEFVKEILSEVKAKKSPGDTKFMLSCMNLLVILASFCPVFLSGSEEELVHLLKEDNDITKEGIAHVLSKAGGTIQEQLAKTSSSVDLLLETLCLEGNRKQAKYSVQALAAIAKDDGLKSLSVLYKRLVDILGKKTHLPSVLQSLGCIAQIAMPVFETRESEVVEFITNNILKVSNETEDKSKTCWDEHSELCLLKIYGIKALVKSYLPIKDAHLRLGVENLLGILKNVLTIGEVSEDIKSSPADKAYLRLASAKAVLRLSRCWEQKIPIDFFHLILRVSEEMYPQARKAFLSKVHQYIKERLLDAKYACVFIFNLTRSQVQQSEFKEDKHNLIEVVQMCQQLKARQLFIQRDVNLSTFYPEYILPYLVHSIAHNSCPDIDDRKYQAFDVIYRQLHLFLSMLWNGYEDGQSVVGANAKESVSTVVSILQSIKHAEDVVDGMKSKKSHAICDLALSITHRLVRKQAELAELSLVPLPSDLYKPIEENDGDKSEVAEDMSWLVGDAPMAHFESLKFDIKEEGQIKIDKSEQALVNSDADEAEIPLGKMMKHLKSQRLKKRKDLQNHGLVEKGTNPENDIDILGMVREINMDNMGRDTDMEIGKSGNDDEQFASEEKETSAPKKGEKRRLNDSLSSSLLKKKRLLIGDDVSASLKKSLKGKGSGTKLRKIDMDLEPDGNSEAKLPREKHKVKPVESDVMASSSASDKSLSSGSKRKVEHKKNDMVQKDINYDLQKHSVLVETHDMSPMNNSKSAVGSTRKRKHRSISGLAKCSSGKIEEYNAELIGCKVKIWWPMDKQFYEGVVHSYDSEKKKHVILYEDGDVEVLNLSKEKWELIGDNKPHKTQKGRQGSTSKGFANMLKRNKKSTAISSRSDSPNKKFRRKLPKKSVARDRIKKSDSGIASESSPRNGGALDSSSSLPPSSEDEEEEVNSDNSKDKPASLMEEVEKIGNNSVDADESDEGKLNGDKSERSETEHSQDSDKDSKHDSDEHTKKHSEEDSRNDSDEDSKKDTDEESKDLDEDSKDSDDEPLSKWKRRAVKGA